MEVRNVPGGEPEAILQTPADLDAACLAFEGYKLWRNANHIRPLYLIDAIKESIRIKRLEFKLSASQKRQHKDYKLPLRVVGIANLTSIGHGALLLMFPGTPLHFPRETRINRPISEQEHQSLEDFYRVLVPDGSRSVIPRLRSMQSIELDNEAEAERNKMYHRIKQRRKGEGVISTVFPTGGIFNRDWD